MRTWSKVVVALAATIAMSEIGACVVLDRVRPEGVLETSAPAVLEGSGSQDVRVAAPGDPRGTGEGIHPYIGFLGRRGPKAATGKLYTLNQRRLYHEDSPIFSTDPDELILAIAGGSVASQFTRFGGAETLLPLLAEMPAYAGRRVRIVKLADGGVKQPQQLMAMQFLLVMGARIDMLVNLDGFNEVALHESENETAQVSTVYPRNWRLRVDAIDAAPIVGKRAFLAERRRQLAEDLLASPLRRSSLRKLVWVARDRELRSGIKAADEELKDFARESSIDSVTQGPRHEASDVDVRRTELVDIWKRSSLQLDDLCRANGIEYFHFLQPNQYVSGSKPISSEEAAVALTEGHPYGRWVPEAYARLHEAGEELRANGVRFHDLTNVFADHPEPLYVDDCCHMDPAANVIMARRMAVDIASW